MKNIKDFRNKYWITFSFKDFKQIEKTFSENKEHSKFKVKPKLCKKLNIGNIIFLCFSYSNLEKKDKIFSKDVNNSFDNSVIQIFKPSTHLL